MNVRKNLKLNTILNFIKTCSSIIFPLITYPYVLRVLLPENVGKVNFAHSIVSYFSLIATLGIQSYAIRECSKVRENRQMLDDTASQIFSINIWTTLLSYILLFLTIFFIPSLSNYKLLIIIASSTILLSTLGADWINVAMEDFVYITVRTLFFQVLSLILMFVFVKEAEDYIKYLLISVVASSGANLSNIIYRRKFCKTKLLFNSIEWKKHITPIIVMFVMIFSQTVFSSADITMLGLIKGDYSVGIYSTASKIERLISQVVSSMVLVLIPRLSYLFSTKDYDLINEMLRKVLGIILILGLPIFAGAFSIADDIIYIIAGDKFIDAIIVFRILLFSFLFSLIGGSFLGNIVFLPSGNEFKYMVICCVTCIVNVIANYFLIPHFSYYAAAGTTAFCSFLIMILLYVTVDKRIRIHGKFNICFGPGIGSVLIGVLCFIIKSLISSLYIRVIISVVLSCLLYCVVLILTKNVYFIEMIKNIWQRVNNGTKK